MIVRFLSGLCFGNLELFGHDLIIRQRPATHLCRSTRKDSPLSRHSLKGVEHHLVAPMLARRAAGPFIVPCNTSIEVGEITGVESAGSAEEWSRSTLMSLLPPGARPFLVFGLDGEKSVHEEELGD